MTFKAILILSAIVYTIMGGIMFHQLSSIAIWQTVVFMLVCAATGAMLCWLAWPESVVKPMAFYMTPEEREKRKRRSSDDDDYLRGI